MRVGEGRWSAITLATTLSRSFGGGQEDVRLVWVAGGPY